MNQRRFTDGQDDSPTIVGKGIHIKGEIKGSASIEIWGHLNGTAETDGVFWVRPGGQVDGEVIATSLVIEGGVKGKLRAKEKAELRADCKVEGDLVAKTIAIAEGSFFEGKIQMAGTGPKDKPAAKTFTEKRS